MCRRRLIRKSFSTLLQHWSGAVMLSGLLVRPMRPLALMLCADRVPIVFMHLSVR